MREGIGEIRFNNGEVNLGTWRNGKLEGENLYTFPDGSFTHYQWRSGQRITIHNIISGFLIHLFD